MRSSNRRMMRLIRGAEIERGYLQSYSDLRGLLKVVIPARDPLQHVRVLKTQYYAQERVMIETQAR